MGCLLKQGGGLYARLRVAAVLLAAGEGKRMGGVAKPLITLQGVPLIKRQLIALSGAVWTRWWSSPAMHAKPSRTGAGFPRHAGAQP